MKKMPTNNRSRSPSPGGNDDDDDGYWDTTDPETFETFNRILEQIIRKKRTPRIEICTIDNLHSVPPQLRRRRRLDNDLQDHDQHQDCKRAIKIKLIEQNKNKNIVIKNHDHDQATLQKKKIKKVVRMEGPEPPPGMPRWLREVVEDMGGEGERLLTQKRLSESDLSRNQNRISMPMRQIRGDKEFLSEEEMRNVAGRKEEEGNTNHNSNNSNRIKGMDVTFVQPYWRTSVLSLRIWEYEKTSSYMFTGKVKEVVENNGLKVGDIVQIWFFRCRNRNPCFALVNLAAEMASSSTSAACATVPEENQPGSTDDTEPSCS